VGETRSSRGRHRWRRLSGIVVWLQAALVLGLDIALLFFGDPTAAGALGVAIFVTGVVIGLAALRGLPASRWPTRVGPGAGTLTTLFGVPAVLVIANVPHASPHHYENVRGVLLSMGAGMAVLYLSSLVDRFFIAPRLSGPGRACLTSLEPRWRALTQIWLLHRLAAYLAFRVAVAANLFFVATSLLHKPSEAVKSAITGVALFVVGYYINRITPIASLAIDPPMYVGDKVFLAEEYSADSPAGGYFVVDVSLDGFKLIELESNERLRIRADRRTHDRLLPITDVPRLLRARRRFTGCRPGERGCGETNPYCEIYKRRVEVERAARGARSSYQSAGDSDV